MRKFKFSNVAAVLALVLAISGGAYAAATIDGSDIFKRSIAGNKLERHAVGSGEIDKKAIRRGHLNTTLRKKLKKEKPVWFHTTNPGRTLAIDAGGYLEFNGIQVGRGIDPLANQEFKFDQSGAYRVTLVFFVAKVNVGGNVLFAVDNVPSHIVSGNPTAGVPLVMDGVVLADKGQKLTVFSQTGLNVQLSSGTEATLTIERLGGGIKPIRDAENPNAEEEGGG